MPIPLPSVLTHSKKTNNNQKTRPAQERCRSTFNPIWHPWNWLENLTLWATLRASSTLRLCSQTDPRRLGAMPQTSLRNHFPAKLSQWGLRNDSPNIDKTPTNGILSFWTLEKTPKSRLFEFKPWEANTPRPAGVIMWSYGGVGKHFKTHCRSFVYPSQTAVGRLCTIKSTKQKTAISCRA